MTINHSKASIVNRTAAKIQQFVLLLRLIDAVSGISTISSHAVTK